MHLAHYYGDRVRALLVSVGLIMMVSMPFFTDTVPKPIFFSILAALGLVVLSGMISPRQRIIVIATAIISALAFIGFEYHAVLAIRAYGPGSGFFIVNQLLSVLCLLATYYGTKSARGLNNLTL